MRLRHLTALAATVAALGSVSTPAHATLVCATTYVNHQATQWCVPWGSPLPHLDPPCPVNVPDLLRVCEVR
jgi:hypothetical protein